VLKEHATAESPDKDSESITLIPATASISGIPSDSGAFTYRPKISVIMPVYNSTVVLTAAVNSIESQSYPNWELCICDDASTLQETKELLEHFRQKDDRIKVATFTTNQGISKATNQALSMATGEYIALLDHDDELAPDAMFEIVKALNSDPEIDFIYSDEDKIDRSGTHVEPFFKPDFSMHLLRSQNYLIHVAVMRRRLVTEVGSFDKEFDGAQDYDLFFRVLEKTDKVHHIRKILYHWRKSAESGAENALAKPWIYETGKRAIQNHLKRLGINATAEIGKAPGLYRVEYAIDDALPVDILIPTRKISFIKNCVDSILSKTTWKNYKIWAIINGKEDYEIVQVKSKNCIELERYTDPSTGLIGPSLPYNWSRMNNVAASATQAPFIILLNDDTTIITEDWIENMMQYAQQGDVGGVGVMLLYPDDLIQHAGDFINEEKMGDHCFNCMSKNSFEINGFAQVVRETSAVTSACMMIRRDVFRELKGFDEELRNYDDYDFCLRLREKGYKIIYTPYVQVYHHESPTRPQILDRRLVDHLLAKHASITQDPFYRYEWRTLYDRSRPAHRQRTLEEIAVNEKSDPLSVLLALYLMRKDLQQAFPEVVEHDYRRLMRWAKETVRGKTGDSNASILVRFADWYDRVAQDENIHLSNIPANSTVAVHMELYRKNRLENTNKDQKAGT